jgi:hypothetical protein
LLIEPLQTISLVLFSLWGGRSGIPFSAFISKKRNLSLFPTVQTGCMDKNSIRVLYLSIAISQGRRRGRGYIGIIIGIRPVSQL